MRAKTGFRNLSAGSLSNKQEHTLQIDGMRGVDLTNSPLFVNKKRASVMSNFIMENNVIQKRNGWTEIYQFDHSHINGCWQFDTTEYVDGVHTIKHHVVIMAGIVFYTLDIDNLDKLEDEDYNLPIVESIRCEIDESRIKDEVAFGMVAGEKLYILCGDFLSIGMHNGQLEVRRVEDDEDTFIPTTTTSISAIGNTVIARQSYDDINMLSRWRYNSLLGESETTELTEFKYVLDGICTNLETVTVEVKNQNGDYVALASNEYQIANEVVEKMNCTTITFNSNHVPLIEGQDNIRVKFEVYNPNYFDMIGGCKFGVIYGYNNLDRLFLSGNSKYPNMIFRSNESNGTDQQDFTYFSPLDYIKLGNTTNSINGLTILGDGTLCALKTPSGQEPTIYLINAIMVTATDREGNPIYVDGVAQVEEQYQTRVGTIGEGLISTSSLQTLAGDTLMLSNNGVFGIVLGSNVASSQRYAKARSRLINGVLTKDIDKLKDAVCFVYNNKYYLCLGNTCYVGDGRYPYKAEDDLSDEYQYEWYVWNNIPARIFFEYKNKLYFGTAEGHIAVFEDEKYVDTTYAEYGDGELLFDSETGYIVMNNVFESTIEKIHDNDIMHLKIENADIFAKLLDKGEFEVDTETNSIKVIKKVAHEYITQMSTYEYYFDNIGVGETVKVYKPYIMNVAEDIDETLEEDDSPTILKFYEEYEYTDENGETKTDVREAQLGNGDYRICYRLPRKNVITDVKATYEEKFDDYVITRDVYYKNVFFNGEEYEEYDDAGMLVRLYKKDELVFNQFKLKTFTTELKTHDIVLYNNSTYLPVGGTFEFNEPVYCLFVTAVFNLGSSVYSKNIKQMIIVPDTMLDTEVDFGYETKANVKYFNAYTGTALNFDKLDFDNLSFESEGFAKAYIKRTRLKNVNFIRFIFKNSSNNNCKISNLTVVYEYGKKNKGVA